MYFNIQRQGHDRIRDHTPCVRTLFHFPYHSYCCFQVQGNIPWQILYLSHRHPLYILCSNQEVQRLPLLYLNIFWNRGITEILSQASGVNYAEVSPWLQFPVHYIPILSNIKNVSWIYYRNTQNGTMRLSHHIKKPALPQEHTKKGNKSPYTSPAAFSSS